MENVPCLLCGSDEIASVYELTDFWLEKDTTRSRFVQCARCSLVYQNPRPSASEISAFYPAEYEVFQVRPKQKKNFGFRYGMNKRSSIITRFKVGGRLLDVGCANGQFLAWMRALGGWDVYGVEPSADAAIMARQEDLPVFTGSIEQADFPSGFFDVVTLWDVIEHVHDPSATLREVQRVLKPDGVLVMRLPNHDSVDAKIFGKYWAGFDAPRHLYVFGIRTIEKLLENTRFTPFSYNSRVGGYLNFVKSVRFFMVGKGVKPNFRRGIVSILSSWPMRIIMAPLALIKDSGKRGSEIVIVAAKKDRP